MKSDNIHINYNKEPKVSISNSYCSFLDLTRFKVEPCKADSNSHNLKRCPYYHD